MKIFTYSDTKKPNKEEQKKAIQHTIKELSLLKRGYRSLYNMTEEEEIEEIMNRLKPDYFKWEYFIIIYDMLLEWYKNRFHFETETEIYDRILKELNL